MSIRLLTGDDAAAFQRLRHRALSEEPDAFGTSVAEHEAMAESEQRSRLEAPNSLVLGVFMEGRLVGCAGLLRKAQEKTRHKALVWGVYVEPEARGKGVARALMERLIELARATPGLLQLDLAVSTSRPGARRLYESLGFFEFGREPAALRINGELVDQTLMALRL